MNVRLTEDGYLELQRKSGWVAAQCVWDAEYACTHECPALQVGAPIPGASPRVWFLCMQYDPQGFDFFLVEDRRPAAEGQSND
jgi:hypothetical protein